MKSQIIQEKLLSHVFTYKYTWLVELSCSSFIQCIKFYTIYTMYKCRRDLKKLFCAMLKGQKISNSEDISLKVPNFKKYLKFFVTFFVNVNDLHFFQDFFSQSRKLFKRHLLLCFLISPNFNFKGDGCILSIKHLCLISINRSSIYHCSVSNIFICIYIILFSELQRGLSECLDFYILLESLQEALVHITLFNITIFSISISTTISILIFY